MSIELCPTLQAVEFVLYALFGGKAALLSYDLAPGGANEGVDELVGGCMGWGGRFF